jgi:hypothetical protein
MNFTQQASALLWSFNPFAPQSHQTAETHYFYNPLYEGYHTIIWPGDCTSSLIMETYKLVALGDLGVEDVSFVQLLGFPEVRSNPYLLRWLYSVVKEETLIFSSKIHSKRKRLIANLAQYAYKR